MMLSFTHTFILFYKFSMPDNCGQNKNLYTELLSINLFAINNFNSIRFILNRNLTLIIRATESCIGMSTLTKVPSTLLNSIDFICSRRSYASLKCIVAYSMPSNRGTFVNFEFTFFVHAKYLCTCCMLQFK